MPEINKYNNEIYDQFIKLSKIFKEGFTIKIKKGNISQYTNMEKPYITAYKTIIIIDYNKTSLNNNQVKFNHVHNKLQNCIVGGYYNKDDNTYKIELCKTFNTFNECLIFGYKYKQKSIYDISVHKEFRIKNFKKIINYIIL